MRAHQNLLLTHWPWLIKEIVSKNVQLEEIMVVMERNIVLDALYVEVIE
jgi:hypothetical protein